MRDWRSANHQLSSYAFSVSVLQLAALPIQLIIGLGLVFYPASSIFRIWGVILLIGFAVFNAVSQVLSLPPCNCIPSVKLTHGSVFIIDVCLAVALFLSGFILDASRSRISNAKQLIHCSAMMLILACTSFCIKMYSDAKPALVAVHKKIAYGPASLELELVSLDVALRNNLHTPVKIYGATASCACTAINGLPVRLLPGEYRTVPVQIKSRKRAETIRVPVVLFTDSKESPRVHFEVSVDFE